MKKVFMVIFPEGIDLTADELKLGIEDFWGIYKAKEVPTVVLISDEDGN